MLTGPGPGVQLGRDRGLVAAQGGCCGTAPAVPGRALPPEAAPFGPKPDVTLARALPIGTSTPWAG